VTLLSAVQNVANEASYTIDGGIIGSNDVTTKQLNAIANRVINEMLDAYPWPSLFKQHSFTLTSGQATYALPGDFSEYHYDTWWNSSDGWRIVGPMSPQEYAEYLGFGITSLVTDKFQIRGVTNNQITIYPTPTATGDTIIFEYLAARPIRPPTWASGQSITSGQYRFYNGNYYTASTTATSGATPPTHTTGSVSDGAVTWAYYSGTYDTFVNDADVCVLPQRILEQGMLERFAEIKGLTVVPRFDTQLHEEYSKQITGKILYANSEYSDRFQFGRNGRVVFG
jgi:hypothetical protein